THAPTTSIDCNSYGRTGGTDHAPSARGSRAGRHRSVLYGSWRFPGRPRGRGPSIESVFLGRLPAFRARRPPPRLESAIAEPPEGGPLQRIAPCTKDPVDSGRD